MTAGAAATSTPARSPARSPVAALSDCHRHALRRARRVLLLDVDDQKRWIGSRVGPEVHIPPVALMMLATVLRRERPDVTVRVAKTSLHARTDTEFQALLDDFRPDVVGVRSISFFFRELQHVAEFLRATAPDVPVIVGGPLVSSLGADALERCPHLALAAAGEGEFILPELLSGARPETVPGVIVRTPEGIVTAPPRPLVADLDALPHPDHSLIDLAEYEERLSYAYNHRRQGVLYTSRGCIFRCSFCFQPSGVGARYRSAGNVVDEITELVDTHDVRDFYVIDDIFNVNRRRTLDVLDGILARGLDVRLYFVNGLRADLTDEAMIDRMVAAGTVWVTYAIESVVPETQKLIRKEMNMARAERAIRHTQEAGIVVNINTMYGFPNETRAMADRTLDWMATLERPSLLPYHFALKGYEGCEIVDQATEAGWDRAAFLAEAATAYNHPPHGTPTFSRTEMLEHVIDYHRRFGLGNPELLRANVATLRHVGYTGRDLTDMYTVLLNRHLDGPDDIAPIA